VVNSVAWQELNHPDFDCRDKKEIRLDDLFPIDPTTWRAAAVVGAAAVVVLGQEQARKSMPGWVGQGRHQPTGTKQAQKDDLKNSNIRNSFVADNKEEH